MRGHRLSVLAFLAGCAPGNVQWATGADALRTALYSPGPGPGVDGSLLFLSTGTFGCDFPSFDDPQEQSEALVAIQAGACREDARHLVVGLHHAVLATPEGRYVLAEPSDGWPPGFEPAVEPHVASVVYIGIEEARAELSEGLVPNYVPTEIDAWTSAAGHEGVVHILDGDGDDHVRGRFDLPVPHVSGWFRAERCPLDRGLFQLLAAAPIASCELATE